jgi:nucleoside-diphosphate-sugar epimerase
MKFVITGATSFIGVELTRYALSMGDEVIAVCRKGSAGIPKLGTHSNLKIVYSELSEYANLRNQIDKADLFVNLAWEGTGHSGRDVTDIQKDNIAHSLEAIKVAVGIGCSLFVEAGSQAEYGTVLDKISETTPCHPFSEYGKAKLAVKEQGSKIANALGMKYLHLRIFSLYGEEDHPWTLVMSSLRKMVNNEPVDLSPCTQNWNFLYVKDAVKQIYLLCQYALKNPEYEADVFNIASKDTRALKDFVKEMYTLSQSKSELKFGAIIPANVVSLDPDTSKTESATGFISDHNFKDIINNIICEFKQ